MRHDRKATALVLAIALLQCTLCGAACPHGAYNDQICSGHGSCSPQNLCQCDSRHTGFDCSQRRCPMGPAWVAPARATDEAHYLVECSNKGDCDTERGTCLCDEGFGGSACQRLECANQCSNAGECMSLKQLSDVYAVGSEALYDNVWDAEMIYGCLCRKGYHGYDCSQRSCPRGDDPLTTGQVNEVQILHCTASGGFFHFFFNGKGTTVPYDATVEQLQAILRTVKTLPPVQITFAGSATTICSSTTTNAVLIEFTHDFGPQPPIKVMKGLNGAVDLTGGDVYAASAGGVLAGRTSVQGSKEWEFCSNRGDCNSETGECLCFINPMPGYRSSDGYGNPGPRGDCGCANDKNKYGGSIKACVGEIACSGHGYCTGSPSFKCVCEKGWTRGDCSSRTCPKGRSWFTAPSTSNTVHDQWTECSDAGICDPTTGQCQCYTPFEGAACDFMKCPGDTPCNGHGQCMSIRQLSLEADADYPSLQFDYGTDVNDVKTFDRDTILGCKCDPGFQGRDCVQRSCPFGDDPVTAGQEDEVQVLKCVATGGVFQLQYQTTLSGEIPFDISASELRDLLMTSLGFEDLTVEYTSGLKACSPSSSSTPNVVVVTFLLDHGDLPALRAVKMALTDSSGPSSFLIADNGAEIDGVVSQMGTKENVVCSNRGYCNYVTGTCTCSFGFGSSDGRGNVGNRDDCGHIRSKVAYVAPLE